jgi:hypothetical protein
MSDRRSVGPAPSTVTPGRSRGRVIFQPFSREIVFHPEIRLVPIRRGQELRGMATFFRASKESTSKSTTSQSRERPSRPRLPPRINISRTKSAVELVESSSDRNEKQVNWGDHQELSIEDGTAISRPHTARSFLLGRPSSSGSKKNLMTAAGSRKNLLASPGSRKSLHSESAKNLINDASFSQYLAFLKACIRWHDRSQNFISFFFHSS